MDKDTEIKKRKRAFRTKLTKSGMNGETMQQIDGLITRAMTLEVEIEAMENDLKVNGWTEMFQISSKVEPSERERPLAKLYSKTLAEYHHIIINIVKLIPKNAVKSADDSFLRFMRG